MGDVDVYPRLSQAILLCFYIFALACIIFVLMAIVDCIVGYDKSIGDPASHLLYFSLGLRWACRKTNQNTGDVFPFTSFPIVILLPLIILLIGVHLISSEFDNILRYLLPRPQFIIEIFDELIGSRFMSLIMLVIVAPVTEELLFRGIILRGFLSQYGEWKAIILSALLFSIFHLNPYQLLPAFVGGLILGWVYLKSGSLWPCIYAHAFFNFLSFISNNYLPRVPGYNTEILDDTHVLFQPIWLDILGVICVIVGMLTLAKLFTNSSIEVRKKQQHNQVLVLESVE